MYRLQKAYARDQHGWRAVDIAHLTLTQAAGKYPRTQLFVKSDGYVKQQLDLHVLHARVSATDRGRTVEGWLARQAPGTLASNAPILELAHANQLRVKDLWDYPVDIAIGHQDFGDGADIPTTYLTDVKVQDRQSTDGFASHFGEYCLFTVNGRLMPPTRINDRVYLHNAKRFIDEAGGLHTLSCVDFSELGNVRWEPIAPDQLEPLAVTHVDKARDVRRYRLNTPYRLDSVSLLPVIEGHPQLLNGEVEIYDAHTAILTVHVKTLAGYQLDTPLAWRKSVPTVNLEGEGVDITRVDPQTLLTSEFSGLVVIENRNVTQHRRPMGRTDEPGAYTYPYPPCGLLMTDRARLADYTTVGYDGDVASVYTNDWIRPLPMHDTVIRDTLPLLSKTLRKPPVAPVTQGWMINLYSLETA